MGEAALEWIDDGVRIAFRRTWRLRPAVAGAAVVALLLLAVLAAALAPGPGFVDRLGTALILALAPGGVVLALAVGGWPVRFDLQVRRGRVDVREDGGLRSIDLAEVEQIEPGAGVLRLRLADRVRELPWPTGGGEAAARFLACLREQHLAARAARAAADRRPDALDRLRSRVRSGP